MNILGENNRLDLHALAEFNQQPALYAAGEEKFWDDPYITKQMLEAHIDPDGDAASRKPETIEATINWLDQEFLQTLDGNNVIDLGCGPGLYTSKLAQMGYQVSGIDLSKNSIQYARALAKKLDLSIKYQIGDYLDWRSYQKYDAATLIYYDFGTFNPLKRKVILNNVHEALRPGGLFIFDVIAENHPRLFDLSLDWSISSGKGFWSAVPYISLSKTFRYDQAKVILDQHVVLLPNGEVKVYRIWEHWFTPESISQELTEHGFEMVYVGCDLEGKPYTSDCPGLGIVARKIN